MNEDIIPEPVWIILQSQGYAVRCWYEHGHTSSMSFKTYEVVEWLGQGSEPSRFEINDDNVYLPLERWEEADYDIEGFLRFDACINWMTFPNHMMHGCGPEHIDNLKAIFTTVYHIGKRTMGLCGLDVPNLPEGAIEIIEHVARSQVAIGHTKSISDQSS